MHWRAHPAKVIAHCELSDHVELYVAAYVPGTHVLAYFGPVSAEIFLPDCDVKDRAREWIDAQVDLLETLREHARLKHANAVIGLEMSLDPFAQSRLWGCGLRLFAVGTAAKLEAFV